MTGGRLTRAGLAIGILAGVALELPGYRAERELFRAASALRIALAGGAPDRASAFSWAEKTAAAAATRLSGDPRPLVLAGSARLALRDPSGALRWFARAQATGERAEIDLNVGRALMLQRDLVGAQRAFLRAGWLSPPLLDELPDVARVPLRGEVERLADLLAAGRLVTPPPPPELPLL